MRFKGTLILLIVCLALGGYLYFYEYRGADEREKAKQAENKVWTFDDKDIRQIYLDSADQRIEAIRKGEQDWTMTAPRQLPADSDEFNRLAVSASNLRRESVVEQNATDLSKFGLDPAQSTLKLKTKDGKEYEIKFGNSNPTGSSTYAALSKQREVFLVANSAAKAFSRKLDDLRNHTVLSFEQPDVQSLSIKSSKGDIELIKDAEDRWWFKGSEQRAADSPEVRGILNALSLGRINQFFDENPQDYANLGLDKPLIEVSLTFSKSKSSKHFLIGSEKSKLKKSGTKKASEDAAGMSSSDLFIAKDESRPDLFFVGKDLIDKLFKYPNDVREKALASFQRWDVDSIILTNPRGSFQFAKVGGEWFLAAAKKKAKWDSVNAILDALEKPVREWIDSPSSLSTYGLDKPLIHVILKQGNKIITDCSLGKAAKDGIYAQIKGDPSVKIADPDGLASMDRGESDFIDPAGTPKK